MIKQTLMFGNPCSLSLRLNQLVIKTRENEEEVTRPIEDIGVMIIENQQIQLTIPLMNALASNNVALIFCGSNFMPNSMLLPLEGNSTQQETYRYQIEASQPTNKRIWKEIIQSKIRNQAECLMRCGFDGSVLKPYYSNVLSGDSDNREGLAAKIYWPALFGSNFLRNPDGDDLNILLNYGYAILRAATARALVGSGLLPAFGIFHRNRYNAFPLADDIMEPYRPFVDELVFLLFKEDPLIKLTKDVKLKLVKVLMCDVSMNNQRKPLMLALSGTTSSLVKVFKDKKGSINCPQFV